MTCPAFESRVHELAEGTLPASERTRVTAHLATCEACAELARQLQGLDVALTRSLWRPSLPPDFDARLWQRIEAEPPLMASDTTRAERKKRLAAEYEAGARRLERKSTWFAALLDGLGLGVLAGGFAYAVIRYAPELLRASFGSSEALNRNLPVTLAASILILVAAFVLTWRPHFCRHWARL
jgi:anti-sigma factor RsiW